MMVDDDDHLPYLPIDRAGRSVFLHAHHRVLLAHFFACLALFRLAVPSCTQPFHLVYLSLRCLAMPRRPSSSDPAKRVTEWMRQPHVLLPFFFIFDNDLLPPSLPCCFCFSSSHLLWWQRCRRHCLSLSPLVPPCLVSVVSCLSIVSFHG